MRPSEKIDLMYALSKLYQILDAQKTETRCYDCQYYGGRGTFRCNLWNDDIPHEVREKGCEKWKFVDDIPF